MRVGGMWVWWVIGLLGLATATDAAEWKPVNPAELALKAPKVQADADAEILQWEVRISDDQNLGTLTAVFSNYVRMKIFTDRGRDAYATVNIPYGTGIRVRDVAARTIKADGTIVELKPSEIYQRTTVKTDDVKEKVVSFAVPGIEKGAVIEYRWRELTEDAVSDELRLTFSREIPIHETRYYIRPVESDLVRMRVMGFNGRFAPFTKEKDGFVMTSLTNVPADREEAFAVPLWERRPWLFIYYEPTRSPATQNVWGTFSRTLQAVYADATKPNGEIRRLAALASGVTPAERAASLMRLLHEKVKRVDTDTASAAERRAANGNRSAGDVLKRGVGDASDVTLLFIAMANAANLDARIAAVPNRARVFLKEGYDHPTFRPGRIVAIRDGAGWLFVDPANEHSATGALRWYFEHVSALIADAKAVVTADTPMTGAEHSVRQRTGTFTLREDGTLEGTCQLSYAGHVGEVQRAQDDQDTPEEREKSFKERMAARFPGGEISEVRVEHLTDPSAPYTISFRLRVPGYAQRTGSRVLFQPAVFQKGLAAVFASETRAGAVYFQYPWLERDLVTIDLPRGFELEQPAVPPSLDAGVINYGVTIKRRGNEQIVFERTLGVGLKETIMFERAQYAPLKQLFDAVLANDAHALVLKRTGVAP